MIGIDSDEDSFRPPFPNKFDADNPYFNEAQKPIPAEDVSPVSKIDSVFDFRLSKRSMGHIVDNPTIK